MKIHQQQKMMKNIQMRDNISMTKLPIEMNYLFIHVFCFCIFFSSSIAFFFSFDFLSPNAPPLNYMFVYLPHWRKKMRRSSFYGSLLPYDLCIVISDRSNWKRQKFEEEKLFSVSLVHIHIFLTAVLARAYLVLMSRVIFLSLKFIFIELYSIFMQNNIFIWKKNSLSFLDAGVFFFISSIVAATF